MARRETRVVACMVIKDGGGERLIDIPRKPLDDMESGKEKGGDVIQRSDRPPRAARGF